MEQSFIRPFKRASSESSLHRVNHRENSNLSAPLNYFPSVDNAVRHFKGKTDAPKVVAISVPLNKRQSFLDNSDEHRLKYHHRSVDELEKISKNTERLRTVFDEEIDLDYIDIVYETNKPSKQHYLSLSCAPPSMPKSISRRIKLQQRTDSRDGSAKSKNWDKCFDETHELPVVLNCTDELLNRTTNSQPTTSKVGWRKVTNSNEVHIEVQSDKSISNAYNHGRHFSAKSTYTDVNPDPFSTAHRLSYFRKTHGFAGGFNRANTKDVQKMLRYSKYINPNFKHKNLR
ncbi:unnamed protein product [Mytilus coruscus]|uniref:Uncharacterized protein n=1 Tax=Mytilus coruscus TaxID=42192 RepID=A0A6J8E7Z5_MYTCO|nr:unnamed protein product [Mytilus coruscus]